MEPLKKEHVESEAVERKSTVLIAQVSWCAHAWNATPEQAAKQVVADLYAHLSRGGSVRPRRGIGRQGAHARGDGEGMRSDTGFC